MALLVKEVHHSVAFLRWQKRVRQTTQLELLRKPRQPEVGRRRKDEKDVRQRLGAPNFGKSEKFSDNNKKQIQVPHKNVPILPEFRIFRSLKHVSGVPFPGTLVWNNRFRRIFRKYSLK